MYAWSFLSYAVGIMNAHICGHGIDIFALSILAVQVAA